MTIDLSEILVNPSLVREYRVELGFDELTMSHCSYPVSHKEPLVMKVSSKGGRLHIEGETEVDLLIPCDRCLDDVKVAFPIRIDTIILPDQDPGSDQEDREEGEAEEVRIDECSCLDGWVLDVDKLVSDEIVIALPTKVLCKEDCRGLCSVCGKNLNHGSCDCEQEVGDPRMAAIRDLFREYNS